MLKLTNVALRRGARLLLSGVDLTVYGGQKVGVTGANGSGKSSLFALISGELETDAGHVGRPRDLVIAQVRQETPSSERSALDYVVDGDEELRRIEQRIAAAHDGAGQELATLHTALEDIDGFSAPARAGRLLRGLGFAQHEHARAVDHFSGGWRMRLNLARALMRRADLLLLDEPTNHLDLDALVWLERWLLGYPGMLLVISHDREFLDSVTTHIAHLEHGTLSVFAGNYSAAERQRAERLQQQQQLHAKQQRQIAHAQKFIDRFRYKASKARQAQSRLKALDRMQTVAAVHASAGFSFAFEPPSALPDPLLRLEGVRAGYGEHLVLDEVEFTLQAGARIGLLGANGAGKSTMMKVLAGALAPAAGDYLAGSKLAIGYFAQHQLEQLDPAATPMQHLRAIAPDDSEARLRSHLGRFGFGGEMAGEPVHIRSGGEKARLVLAMLVYQRPNLLLLDEPTNHLDVEMRQALAEALQDYGGSLVIVAHDRYLLRLVADELWLVDGGCVRAFAGDLDDYVRWLRERQRDDTDAVAEDRPARVSARDQRRIKAETRERTRALRHRVQRLEREIHALERERLEIEQALADPSLYDGGDGERRSDLMRRHGGNLRRKEALEEDWLAACEALETAPLPGAQG